MARLNYHHLYYFWRVATDGNLTQVADNLHVAQSAISTQIRALESSTGRTLFNRSGRRLVLTDAGRRVLSFANDIFARGEELEAWLRSGVDPESQPLRIGMLSTLSRNFIDRLITPLLGIARARFVLESGSLENLLQQLSAHRLDVALTNGDVRGGDQQLWESRLLARQPISILGPPEKRPSSGFPGAYEDTRWVVPTRENEVRRGFEAFCTAHAFTPDVQAEANDMAMLRLLARDSGALAVLPAVVVQDEIQEGTLVEYMRLPDIFESFYAITVKRRHPPDRLQMLLASFDMNGQAQPPVARASSGSCGSGNP